MSKNWNKTEIRQYVSKTSYYMYDDGYSYWGVSLYRNNKTPIECTSEIHNKSIKDKINWYLEHTNSNAERG